MSKTVHDQQDTRLVQARFMPPRYHTIPGEEYSTEASQVIDWIACNDELMEYYFAFLKRNKLIKYDTVTKKWAGVDFFDKVPPWREGKGK